jgi:LuxR family quorum sensing-dependent transcriptional regulator
MQKSLDALGVFSELLASADTARKVTEALHRALQPFGVEACLVAQLAPTTTPSPAPAILADLWPSAWSRHYFSKGLVARDPCAAQCLRSSQLFSWRSIAQKRLQREERAVMETAADFGLRDGFCLPVHGATGEIGVISLAGQSLEHSRRGRFVIEAAGYCSYQKLGRLRQASVRPVLTKRQAEVCDWVAAGKSLPEIAEILGISRETVERHLKDSRARLGAANRVHTVVTAIRRREILI